MTMPSRCLRVRFAKFFWLSGLMMVFLLRVPEARAIIDASLEMQLGNPSGATADPNNHGHYLIQRTVESLDFSDSLGEPNWASWDLTASDIGSAGRNSTFYTDTTAAAFLPSLPEADQPRVGSPSNRREARGSTTSAP